MQLKLKISIDYIRELQQLFLLERRLHKAQCAALGRPSVSPPAVPHPGPPPVQTHLPEPMAYLGKLLLEEMGDVV
jgi:hypothetical protein